MDSKEPSTTFTAEEILMLRRSVHERAMRLLDLSCDMAQKSYRNSLGKTPTMKNVREVKARSDEYFALYAKLKPSGEDE